MEELRLTKELCELTIDPEFRDLIPPLTDEERRLLENSIVANGCESPLTVWNGTIVDGHNRYDICRKHGIPFAVLEKDFADRGAALMWMVLNQLARRNLTTYQRGELATKYIPSLERLSEQGKRNDLSNFYPNLGRSDTSPVGVDKKLSQISGLSHGTIAKVKKIAASADEETKERLRRGDLSIHKVYTDLMQKEHAYEVKTCERCQREKPVSAFNIPSNRHGFSALCKQCEAEVESSAKAAAEVAAQTTEPVETRLVSESVPDADKKPRGNFSTLGELRDIPEHFPKVVEIFNRTLDSCVNGIDYDLRQYKPSMVSAENTAYLRGMIEDAYENTLAIFDNFMSNTYGDGADA